MKQEIEKSQQDLDALKAKYQESLKVDKPLNKWYKNEHGFLFYPTEKSEYRSGSRFYLGYGFNTNGNWFDSIHSNRNLNGCIEAPPTEVQQALDKEAVKRYPIGTRIKTLVKKVEIVSTGKFSLGKAFTKCLYSIDNEGERYGVVFENGIWATPIKEMSLDELANKLYDLKYEDIAKTIVTVNEIILTDEQVGQIEKAVQHAVKHYKPHWKMQYKGHFNTAQYVKYLEYKASKG